MITIINYGSGNINAITNTYKRLKVPFNIADNVQTLEKASKLILPGVGAFDNNMKQLNESGLRSVLDNLVKKENSNSWDLLRLANNGRK